MLTYTNGNMSIFKYEWPMSYPQFDYDLYIPQV